MLIVMGHINVRPSVLADFSVALARLAEVARQREGNLCYEAAVIDATVARLLVAERWRDQAALAAHLRAAETTAFVDRWREHLTSQVLSYEASPGRAPRPADTPVV